MARGVQLSAGMRGAILVASLLLVACSGDGSSSDDGHLGHHSCGQTSDCPVNPAATCAHLCPDGSNPCPYACRSGECVPRGCPGEADAGPVDGAPAPHAEGESCDDGLGCVTGLVCTGVGDPCPTYPNCKMCYLPCEPGGVCPSGYRTCIPPYGQGGNVCVH
jgi:hypothetical protein